MKEESVQQIESLLQEERLFPASDKFKSQALISSASDYDSLWKESVENPEAFWGTQAKENLEWFKKWDRVLNNQIDSLGRKEGSYVSWFSGAQLNITHNCLDRHLTSKGDTNAIIWRGEDENKRRTLSYKELHMEVCKFANVLKKRGVKKGTTVTIYMPMVPELQIAMLACARIGAIHSVVFSAFSAEALRNRIVDCNAEVVITANNGVHGGRINDLKQKVDTALKDFTSVTSVIVYKRDDSDTPMTPTRDVWWHEEMIQASSDCPPEKLEAEDPLFILYTSGSTGKPKGVLHTTAGYSLYTHLTFKYVFDYKEADIFWCTADIGWITGHSYMVYGPLSNGATSVMFEGIPTYPNPDRFWQIVEQEKVSIFYTAPTAIRALERLGNEWPNKHDLSSLRLLGTVGEPINPEAWMWYHQTIGHEKCPIVDTWWQTETGGIMITTLPGAQGTKPGSAGKPFFGISPLILKEGGKEAGLNEGGALVIDKPWPGMIRGVYGDSRNELIHNVYFSMFSGKYFTGDGCRKDKDGYYWLLGRIDDVINVSAHRFATAEIESALVSHSSVAEAAVVGCPHETKGQGIYCFVTLMKGVEATKTLENELVQHVRNEISPIATPERIQFAPALPKTRSGKIMRRILRKIAEGALDQLGDTSTLSDPKVVDMLVAGRR